MWLTCKPWLCLVSGLGTSRDHWSVREDYWWDDHIQYWLSPMANLQTFGHCNHFSHVAKNEDEFDVAMFQCVHHKFKVVEFWKKVVVYYRSVLGPRSLSLRGVRCYISFIVSERCPNKKSQLIASPMYSLLKRREFLRVLVGIFAQTGQNPSRKLSECTAHGCCDRCTGSMYCTSQHEGTWALF